MLRGLPGVDGVLVALIIRTNDIVMTFQLPGMVVFCPEC